MFKNWPPYFFDAPDSGSGGGTEADIALLENEGDIKEDELEELEDDDKEEKEDDKEVEDEEEELEETDDEEEDKEKKDDKGDKEEKIEPNEFSVKALKETYPEVFKKFPELKDAIYRDRKFIETFGSVEDAIEAKEKADLLDEISATTLAGDPTELIAAVSKSGGLEAFAENFLPALHQTNKDLYFQVTDKVIARTLRAAVNHGSKAGDSGKNLVAAAKYISHFVFGEVEIPNTDKTTERKIDPERQKFEREKQEHNIGIIKEHETSIHNNTRERLTRMVLEGLDPDNTMNDFVKEALRDKIIDKVGEVIERDKVFQSQITSLWRRANADGFSKEAKNRIITAYLSRARRVIPSVRAKVRSEAVTDSNNKLEHKTKKLVPSSSGNKSSNRVPGDSKKINWSKNSDEDLLSGEYKE